DFHVTGVQTCALPISHHALALSVHTTETRGGSSAGQSIGLIIRGSWVQVPPALPTSPGTRHPIPLPRAGEAGAGRPRGDRQSRTPPPPAPCEAPEPRLPPRPHAPFPEAPRCRCLK